MTPSEPLNANDLAARFEAMLAELDVSPRVRIHDSARIELPAESRTPDAIAADMQKYAAITVSADLRRCRLPFASFSLTWEDDEAAPEAADVVGGEMALTYLHNVASQQPDLVTENTPEAERVLLRSLRVIDDQPVGGNGTFAAVRLDDGQLLPDVWFYELKTGAHRLELDYCGYLDALPDTFGFYRWQFLFADVDLTRPEHRLTQRRLRRTLDVLPVLFPGRDFDDLVGRLAARTKKRRTRRRKAG